MEVYVADTDNWSDTVNCTSALILNFSTLGTMLVQ